LAKYYIWFVVIVAGLAGVIRLLLPRRFAELQMERFRAANAIAKEKIFGALYFLPWGHQSWVVIGTVFSLLSAAEAYFQARFPTLESLVFQSRLLGILYLGLAAGSYVILKRV
jgi:hypothetical protein